MIQDLLILPDGRKISSGAAETVTIESLRYTRSVNPADNWDLGSACAAQIQVKLLDLTGSFSIAPGTAITHYRVDAGGNRALVGTFYTEKATRPGKYSLSFTAYDAMVKAEVDLTGWLASLPDWPYTIEEILAMVCEKCGISLAPDVSLCNGAYPVLQFARSVTGRQLIAWVAGANGAYAAVDGEGVLYFSDYTQNPTPITANDCKALTLADSPCAPIARVAIGQDESDLAAVWPEEGTGECYHITGNPLLTAFSQPVLKACAQNIYERVAGFSYTPFETEVFADTLTPLWQPGQLVTAEGKLCAVFSMELSGSAAKLRSTGSPTRSSATARYSRDAVQLLQGQMTRVTEEISGVSAQVSQVTTTLEELEVGGRNRILKSQSLDDESYYFVSGSATSGTATVTGNPVVITDADPRENTLQVEGEGTVTLCGKNLIPYPYHYKTCTIGGITFTDNGDGTLTLNGTATERTVFYCNTKTTAVALPQGAVVTLSGTPQGYAGKCFIQSTNETAYPTDNGAGITFTADGSYRFYIVVAAGVTLEDMVICPQLEVGSTATEFESYTARQVTPGDEDITALYPVTTLMASSGTLTVTYNRIAALAAVADTPPEGEDPVLRFTVDELPESFVMPGLMEIGQVYTLSFWAKGEGSLTAAGQSVPLTGSWEKHSRTFTAESGDLTLEFGTVGTFDLYHPQLEKGSVPTDWSVAPEDMDAVLLTAREEISRLQVAADKISAQVSQTETAARADMALMESNLESVKKQTELAVTAQQLELAISAAREAGAQKVVTQTGYTFDESGLTIATSRSDIRNLLDHTGMLVTRGEETLLQADASGVTARDVTVHNYLIIGTHARVEDYDTNRTACFWL